MKQKDIGLYIVIAVSSAVISVIFSNYLITPNKIKKQQSEVVDLISPTFVIPKSDDKYFNKEANNPTKLIQIGDETDPNINTIKKD